MRSDVFFDTNVLIYAVTPLDPRGETALELVAAGGVISVQVLNEFVVAARRRLKWSLPQVHAALAEFRMLCRPAVALTGVTHDRAMGLAVGTGFAFYDCLIVAAALEAGCGVLFSEDMQDGRVIEDRLVIRNPFLG